MRDTNEIISLKDVRKSYGDFALGPVDLRLEPGYVVAVVGPNGSGKSTLFRMLMGLTRPDSGDLSLFGMAYPDDEVEIRHKIGYVPERAVGHDSMTVKELGGFVAHWYPDWERELYEDILSRSKIDRRKKFRDLSKGMQRRLSFALAASTGAELLLLDEPTDGVDPFARREMLADISRFMDGAGDERTVVMATHVMEEVRRIADYVAFLVDGEFLGMFEKDALLESWRTLWVEGEPDGELPGVVGVEAGSPTRLVTDSPGETEAALAGRNIRVVRSGPLDLEEILGHLMRRRDSSSTADSPV